MRTGFARADDGIELYWAAQGGRGLPLVCCNGVGVSTFFWRYVVSHFAAEHRVLVWDYRGHGRSAVPTDINHADLSIERNARDLLCVLDAAGLHEPVVLLGHSMGVQVILEFYKQFPERTAALVPMFGTYGRPLDTFMGSRHARLGFRVLKRLVRASGPKASRAIHPLTASPWAYAIGRRSGFVDRYYAEREDVQKYLEHLNHMDTRVFIRMVELMADHDLEALLPDVGVPTMVFGADNDLFTPLHCSQTIAREVPDAELLVLPEGSHAAIVEHPHTINQRLERFLAERLST